MSKPLPVNVTVVPPAIVPCVGVKDVTDGAGLKYWKAPTSVALCVSVFVTVTSVAPLAPAGVVALMVVLLMTDTFDAALVPNFTLMPEVKWVPEIITVSPPAVVPLLGDTLDIVGTSEYV